MDIHLCKYHICILNGHGCKKCVKYKKSNTEEFIKKAIVIHNNKYNYSKSNYIDSVTKIIIICNKCNNEFLQKPSIHLSGSGCLNCMKTSEQKNKLKYEEILVRCNDRYENYYDYSLLNNNINTRSIVKIICPNHGVFQENIHNHMNGKKCPNCINNKKSGGEEIITNLLNNKNIKCENKRIYDKEYIFIPDFYIKELNLIIEFNGRQHYQPVSIFGGEDRYYNYQIPRDNALRKYCENNNINLLEINGRKYERISKNKKEELENYIIDYIQNFNH